MSLARFVFLSAVLAALLFAGTVAVVAVGKLGVPTTTLALAAVCGFFVSTVGWGIVRVGMRERPERIVVWFGVAVLVKLMMLAAISGVVVIEGSMELGEFLVPFATVFLLLGFAQLAATVKEATRQLDEGAARADAVPTRGSETTEEVEG